MWSFLVFAAIGLLVGSAARVFYPGRQPLQILGTMLLGMVGALAGGMVFWMGWPLVEGEFPTESLVLSFAGALILIVVGAAVSYGRRISGARTPPR